MALSPNWPHNINRSRKSPVLSLSSLVNDVTASTVALDDDLLLLTRSSLQRPQGIASDACTDITRELEAVEARLNLYRHARSGTEGQQSERHTNPHSSPESDEGDAGLTIKSSSLSRDQHQQDAEQVADEVENALFNCDQLLRRARASGDSIAFLFKWLCNFASEPFR